MISEREREREMSEWLNAFITKSVNSTKKKTHHISNIQKEINMDDTEKFKKYLKYLNKQLDKFQNDVKAKVLNKSLDDRLNVELSGNDKSLERLQTCNELAYLLSSLVFIYQKLNCDKDMSNVVRELGRIQSYMSEYEQLQKKNSSSGTRGENTNEETPVQSSISQQNFSKSTQPQGVHIKFQDMNNNNFSADTSKESTNEYKDNEIKDVSSQILEKLSKKHAGSGGMKKKKGIMKAKRVSKN